VNVVTAILNARIYTVDQLFTVYIHTRTIDLLKRRARIEAVPIV
jgi:hypothetical protein